MPPEGTGTAPEEGDAGMAAAAPDDAGEDAEAEKAPATEPTSGLLSNDLLDELGPGGGNAAATPPVGTPSEPATPCEGPRAARKDPALQAASLMSIDPWDWKTDAPEFVPGGMFFFSPQAMPPFMGGKGCSGGNAGGKGSAGGNADGGGCDAGVLDSSGGGSCGGKGEGTNGGCGPCFPGTSGASGPGQGFAGGSPTGAAGPGVSLVAPSIWTVAAPGPGAAGMSWGTLVPVGGPAGPPCAVGPAPGSGVAAAAAAAGSDAEVQQLRAHYEWQVRRQDEELRALQQRMGRLEQKRAEVKETWERERQGLVREISRYAAVLTRYAIPLEEACEGASPDQPWVPPSSLDAKMRRLNGLLLEDPPRKRFGSGTAPAERPPPEHNGEGSASNHMPAGSIASTLQAMFPHATIRTQTAEADAEPTVASAQAGGEKASSVRDHASGALADSQVSQLAEDLERLTKSQIDERALRALQGLHPSDALEVLRKVEDLVNAQGGFCRNLSSILQSVCRKLERRSSGRLGGERPAAADGEEETVQYTGPGAQQGARATASEGREPAEEDQAKSPARARRRDGAEGEEEGAEDGEHAGRREQQSRRGEESDGSNASGRAGANGRGGESSEAEGSEDAAAHRGMRGSRGDSGAGEASARGDYWSDRRIERVAQRGFELKRRGDRWDLKLAMSGLDPPLTEAGMERYCVWLHERLSAFRDEHGSHHLRRCCGEVDFSSNGLSNQAVWILLETLAQHEVHAACLKLYKNNISQGGILAMCEFIRANRRAGPVHEMHLSHNEIDDESALELLRTLQEQRSRYPPRRVIESNGAGGNPSPVPVPVWVRLNQNRIRDPPSALRTLESEGITYCNARNAHVCGPGKCARPECPLVHLYLFVDQAPRRRDQARESQRERGDWDGQQDTTPGGGAADAGAAKRKHRRKARFREGDVGGEEAAGAGRPRQVAKPPAGTAIVHP